MATAWPTIPDGAIILVDGNRIEPLDGKIYVIRIDERLWVKRVQWIPGGGLRLISDNRIYGDTDITKANCTTTSKSAARSSTSPMISNNSTHKKAGINPALKALKRARLNRKWCK